jgi:hypothetical protein
VTSSVSLTLDATAMLIEPSSGMSIAHTPLPPQLMRL